MGQISEIRPIAVGDGSRMKETEINTGNALTPGMSLDENCVCADVFFCEMPS